MNQITSQMLDALTALVDQAGESVMRIYAAPAAAVHVKADLSPVTDADLAANAIITAGLRQGWPAIPILTEEGVNGFKPEETPHLYWAVDPLDGTKEFIKRNGEFTVNVALIEDGRAVLGVVGAPAMGLVYRAHVEGEAQVRRVGQWSTIRPSPPQPGQALRVAASRSHPSPQVTTYLARYQSVELHEIGSSLKFCLLAEGRYDIYPKFGATCIWDTAAGQAILEAVGGRVVTMDDQPLRYPRPGHALNPDFLAWAPGATSELFES